MVSIGTVITLGIIGAASIGAYALYRNADKAGGALSRGVEENISVPLGNWFDNLWQSVNPLSPGPGQDSPINPVTIFDPLPPAYGDLDYVPPPSITPTPDYPSLVPPGTTPTPGPGPTTTLVPTPGAPTLVPPGASTPGELLDIVNKFKEGYYYFNVVGSEWDTQQFVSESFAKQLNEADPSKLFHPGGLTDITYIGKTALGEAGFKLFGESKGYL